MHKMPLVEIDDDGIRPAGSKTACFYCHSTIGEPHKHDCVSVTRRVKVRFSIELAVEVPVSWGKKQIEFKYNEGSWCSDNIQTIIENELSEIDGKKCFCHEEYKFKAEFLEGV